MSCPIIADTAPIEIPQLRHSAGSGSRVRLERCPDNSSCDGCGRQLRRGWPVRPSNGKGATPWMCPPCWWDRELWGPR